jgi:hypothetical protein
VPAESCPTARAASVCEERLPLCVRDVLDDARAARPDAVVTCIAFHTRANGRPSAQMGLKPESLDDGGGHSLPLRFRAKDVLVLSVAVTETTFGRVQTVTHVLVTHVRPIRFQR